MSNPRGTTKSWRQRQERDPYVRQARRLGYRSRAVFKLDQLLERGDMQACAGAVVVELGAAPGGWSQYLAARLENRARIAAVDLLEMDEVPGVHFIQGDFREPAVLDELRQWLNGAPVRLVISDMAPNLSGNRSTDQPKAMYLAELALAFASEALAEGGTFLCKVFQGEGFEEFVRCCRARFETVRIRKPKASRHASREVYVLARNYLMV